MLAPVAKCQDFVDRGKLLTNKVVTGLILCQQPESSMEDIMTLLVSTMWPFLNLFRISGLSWFNWWISFAPEFQCDYFCESSCLFYLSFNSDFYVSKIMHL